MPEVRESSAQNCLHHIKASFQEGSSYIAFHADEKRPIPGAVSGLTDGFPLYFGCLH